MATPLFTSHLEQMTLCAASIADLDFSGPRMFTNALLSTNHDITALIRDTEPHERALFSLAPPPVPALKPEFGASTARRAPATTAKRHTAVAAVLGRDLFRRLRAADAAPLDPYGTAPRKGDVDVGVLLEGAAKLCATYPVAGAAEEIAALRARYAQLGANIAHYEDRVERNARRLESLNSRSGEFEGSEAEGTGVGMTREDLERDEREIRELERKKAGLEDRVSEMDKDLGGLMR